jgi:hypothetical protein
MKSVYGNGVSVGQAPAGQVTITMDTDEFRLHGSDVLDHATVAGEVTMSKREAMALARALLKACEGCDHEG